ncbi:DNA polymerase Y family protein [Endozoicomonas sp. G2_2]|uniref:Y-family DNA polymerase n=1 Tax=Endozoicomonas sp. G2_2 TaxID=2821092 RepID=UPI001AD9969B|nr:DNA polymerase Y family protein [Endozoicomonas sp. G2_2]MBO9469185.1 DNA polymerase Y family protein [Endozoicomonas sp. G2_2]
MWLALLFPHWALDSRGAMASQKALALVADSSLGRRHVIAASEAVVRSGVQRLMELADAQLRAPDACVLERRADAESAALERLAGWAWRYSAQVHVARESNNVATTRLVFEIGASLRLFGGQRALIARIQDNLADFGYRHNAGIGDTPAMALARAHAPRRLRSQPLARLPLSCLALPSGTLASLQASGLREIGELLSLPSAMLHKRYGAELLEYLDRLHGFRPHGLACYRPPQRHITRHELFGAVESVQGLAFVLRRVFIELGAVLRGAGAAIQTLKLALIHDQAPTTRLTLHLSAPSRSADHFERIAQYRLARLDLVAPVLEIGLATDQLRPVEPDQQTIEHDNSAAPTPGHWPAVLDRLRARLGHDAVYWLHAPADHRPERASCRAEQPTDSPTPSAAPRPLWLIEPPRPAPANLRFISGPERIETGWWDEATSVRRDYFRAVDGNGRQLWVYRRLDDEVATGSNVDTPRYYLHGLFG